jgi:succinoglycan biosynthesis protein ExoM
MNIKHIDICIATFKRPPLLLATLQSIAALRIDNIVLRVIVVDNDINRSAESTVAKFQEFADFDVIYDVEPEQNIALARNRALTHVTGTYIAFVDDDEEVEPEWLQRLVETLWKFKADIVFGPVISVLPEDAPNWIRKGGYFSRPRLTTGAKCQRGATGNLLMKADVAEQPHSTFNPYFGLTGGSDSEYFDRLRRQGKRMVWCDEAIVTEKVHRNRLNATWLRMRAFRGGQTYARIVQVKKPLHEKIVWVMVKVSQLMGALILLPLLRFSSYRRYASLKTRAFAAIGQLSILVKKVPYEEYRASNA